MNQIPRSGLIKITKSKNQNQSSSLNITKKEKNTLRQKWKINSKVQLYSDSLQKWVKGTIIRIFNDNEGEWLRIQYMGNREKEIQRFSDYIRPIITPSTTTNKQQQQTTKQQQKPKQPERITTQSKYKKREKIPQKLSVKENEIQIKGAQVIIYK